MPTLLRRLRVSPEQQAVGEDNATLVPGSTYALPEKDD